MKKRKYLDKSRFNFGAKYLLAPDSVYSCRCCRDRESDAKAIAAFDEELTDQQIVCQDYIDSGSLIYRCPGEARMYTVKKSEFSYEWYYAKFVEPNLAKFDLN